MFTNTSDTPLRFPFFGEELSGDNLVLNADRGPGGVGATVTPEVGERARPRGVDDGEFVIGLRSGSGSRSLWICWGSHYPERADRSVGSQRPLGTSGPGCSTMARAAPVALPAAWFAPLLPAARPRGS